MKGTYRIIWSEEALSGFKEIIAYLEYKFPEKDIKKFIQKFEKQLEIIRSNPKTFPVSFGSKSVRRSVVAKLTSIYYSIDQDTIRLLAIRDNRKKLPDFRTLNL